MSVSTIDAIMLKTHPLRRNSTGMPRVYAECIPNIGL